MVDLIRNKWCEDLEEILQCPYCMIIPKSHIRQCIHGHHVCQGCRSRMYDCPTCSATWSDTRNRLAEALCSKFDDMKTSLMDPDYDINKLLIPDKVSIACQTDAESIASKIVQKSHQVPYGTYPCRIDTCNFNRQFDLLMNHLKTDHPDHFLQLPQDNGFKHTWTFEYRDNMTFDWAVQIADMGTFFLKLSTDIFGDLTGLVLMAEKATISKSYSYQLQVSCCEEHESTTHCGTVLSCRTVVGILPEKSLQMKRFELKRLTEHTKKLQCSLVLSKKGETDEAYGPQQAQKKNRRKRNNNAAKQPTANGQSGPRPGPSNDRIPVEWGLFAGCPAPQQFAKMDKFCL